ncbi:MAG TPA: murein biosynthesis integral membrane protein MurJ [Methylomirabilota bacterium]|jgi:putative peptidoglycan lipid II flippase|nr:murein biosynthesis integral membrane protein MurJ [Methylomirabilota bacterium]
MSRHEDGLTEAIPADGQRGAERGVVRAAAVVGGATLVSRVLGFLRDLVVAQAFGAGPATDAFFVAFRLPNLLRRLVGEGALSSAFIPVFTEYLTTRPRGELERMYRAVAGGMVVVLATLTLLGVLGAPLLVRVMAPGFFADPAVGALTVRLTRVMFPYLFFVGLGALAMGMLQVHRHFLLPALAPVMLNLSIIGAVFGVAPHLREPVFGLAIGVLVGGAGQLLIQLPALARRGLLVTPTADVRHPAVARIVRLMAPVAVGQSASQLNILVDTIIASFLVGGSVSYLYYADRLVEFPLGVFGIAIATAVLPTLSEQAATGNREALRSTLSFALRLAAFITLPAAVGLFVLRVPLVRVLYQRGYFGPEETAGTAWALGFYTVGLVGFASAKIGAQAFYALGDTRTPVKVAIGAMVMNSLLAIGLAFPLRHGGLALATSCSAMANALALAWLLRRRLGAGPVPGARAGWLRIAAASGALASALVLASAVWPPPPNRVQEAVWLAGMIAGGIVVYGAAHVGLGSEEVDFARRAVARRLGRSRLP